MSDKLKIEIETKLLQRIAAFYEFPFAVFFMQSKDFPSDKTKPRRKAMHEKVEAFNKIKEIVEEVNI
ncbi:MAG: hypothetical protein HY376_03050 [Candidatus Blackburnbacteria bacterium]|nr:hypothetical protein [Candidatus Blackburnbacteria bacterium]